MSGHSTVGQSRLFVDGQEDVQISHQPQNRVISVLESFRELTECDGRKKQLDLGVFGQKGVCRPFDT